MNYYCFDTPSAPKISQILYTYILPSSPICTCKCVCSLYTWLHEPYYNMLHKVKIWNTEFFCLLYVERSATYICCRYVSSLQTHSTTYNILLYMEIWIIAISEGKSVLNVWLWCCTMYNTCTLYWIINTTYYGEKYTIYITSYAYTLDTHLCLCIEYMCVHSLWGIVYVHLTFMNIMLDWNCREKSFPQLFLFACSLLPPTEEDWRTQHSNTNENT